MGPEIPKGIARAASSTLIPVFRTMKALVFANARVRSNPHHHEDAEGDRDEVGVTVARKGATLGILKRKPSLDVAWARVG
jgi:hypothetical protein